MRWERSWFLASIAGTTCVLGCADEPSPVQEDPARYLVAVRELGSTWHVPDVQCGVPIEWAGTQPYELVIVRYSDDRAGISVTQAAPSDGLTWTVPCPLPANGRAPVKVVGADEVVVDMIGQGAVVDAPEEDIVLTPGISDVVARTTEDTPERFLIERAVKVTLDGLTLDFAANGMPTEQRTLTYQGQAPGEKVEPAVVLTTAGGVTSHFASSRPLSSPTTVAMVPSDALIDGDREVLEAKTSYQRTLIDVRQTTSSSVVVPFRFPIQSASAPEAGDGVDLEVVANGTWNEGAFSSLLIDANEMTASLHTYRGWPDQDFRFSGFTDIPGWDPNWNLSRFGSTRWAVEICDRQPIVTQCASLRPL